MPVDLSTLSDEELEAYASIVERKEASTRVPEFKPSGRLPEGLKGPSTVDPITGIKYQNQGGADRLGGLDPEAYGKGALQMLLGQGTASAFGPALNAMKGVKGVLASAGVGAGESLASNGIRKATGEDVSKTDLLLGAGLGGGLAGFAKGLSNSVDGNKFVQAKNFVSSLLGKETDPRSVSQMPGVTSSVNTKANTSPMGRVFAQTMGNATRAEAEKKAVLNSALGEGQRLKENQAQLKAQTVKLKNAIDSAKRAKVRNIGKMEQQFEDMENSYLEPGIDEAIKMVFGETPTGEVMKKLGSGIGDALENKAEILAARKQLGAAKTGQLKIPEGPLNAEVPNARIETLQQNLGKTREAMEAAKQEADRFKAIDLPKLKETLQASPAVDPRLRPFMKAATPSEFLGTIEDTNHENVKVLRDQLSPAGKKALEESFSRRFAQLAVGPDGSLSGINEAAKKYDFDKVAAIYGGDSVARLKAHAIQTVVDDTRRLLQKDSTIPGGPVAKTLAMASLKSSPYLLYRMTHANTAYAAADAAAIGGTVVAIAWPKIIDAAVKSPRFGTQFHKWATEGAVPGTLKNYPLVQDFFTSNNEAGKEKGAN